MSVIAPHRAVDTVVVRGRECYVDTRRPVDERLGSHVVLWIVEDPEAWAREIEARADAELAQAPRRDRGLAEWRRRECYNDAEQVRVEGPRRTWRTHEHTAQRAEASVRSLRRAHPNPGVRYEVVPVTGARACSVCHQPMIEADGQWRHHLGRYPAECGEEPAALEEESPLAPGEWEIDIGHGTMTCGYCAQVVGWAHAGLGYARLTGQHMLGIEKATGRLVVLAEATTLGGERTLLPHHCEEIPAEVVAEYATEAAEYAAEA